MSALASIPFRHGDAEFAMLMHLSGYGLETLDLERAFDGLIAWPAGEGFTDLNATERRMLLIGVCERLMEADDKRRIPPQTYDTIVDFVDARISRNTPTRPGPCLGTACSSTGSTSSGPAGAGRAPRPKGAAHDPLPSLLARAIPA